MYINSVDILNLYVVAVFCQCSAHSEEISDRERSRVRAADTFTGHEVVEEGGPAVVPAVQEGRPLLARARQVWEEQVLEAAQVSQGQGQAGQSGVGQI